VTIAAKWDSTGSVRHAGPEPPAGEHRKPLSLRLPLGLPPGLPREKLTSIPRGLEYTHHRHLRNYIDTAVQLDVPYGQGDYTREMVEQLRREIAQYEAAVKAVSYLADRPDEIVLYTKLQEQSGVESKYLNAELGQITRASRRLFGSRKWPFKRWQASDGESRYQMPRRIAEWWKVAS
jgi:antitoxin component HigA of HigAB toxin-antitoxin module